MTQVESTLGDAGELLQSARELVVSAGNGALTDTDRQSIATQLKGVRAQLLALANQSNGAGTYLFGGQSPTTQPFVDGPAGVTYAGTPGQTLTEQSTGLPLTTDGNAAWLTARTGNGVFVTSAGAGVRTRPSAPGRSRTRAR